MRNTRLLTGNDLTHEPGLYYIPRNPLNNIELELVSKEMNRFIHHLDHLLKNVQHTLPP